MKYKNSLDRQTLLCYISSHYEKLCRTYCFYPMALAELTAGGFCVYFSVG